MSSVAPILVAEDDANDVFLLRRAFKKAGLLLPVVEARNGQEAINYLLGHGPFSNRGQHPFPSLMFLDLKMPLLNGFDVLAAVQSQATEYKLPIVILTSSN